MIQSKYVHEEFEFVLPQQVMKHAAVIAHRGIPPNRYGSGCCFGVRVSVSVPDVSVGLAGS